VFKIITERLAAPPQPTKRGRQGRGGNGGGWRAYVRKHTRKPGIVAFQHEQQKPERVAALKDDMRQADVATSRPTGEIPKRSPPKPQDDHGPRLRR